ncbi:MAG: folate-binding protein YgfZ, partial [Gammaproteobacteria bacterium]|nr:folate-binding protein YgfZ [Gammaproteobacteria bacterium]
LQSQFTNDAREINTTRSQLSGYCSAKGRLLALFRIFQRGEAVCLQFPQELLEPTLKRLRMFVMRAKVTLDDASDTWVRIGLAGPQAEQQLSDTLGRLPQAVNEVVTADDITVLRLPGMSARFEMAGELAAIKTLWQRLAAQAVPVGAPVWSLLDILAGVPEVFTSSADEFVPQMVNLTALGGVNFKKGCYPGQEIVARMQYLGTLKRRMYLAHCNADSPPAARAALYEAGSDGTQSVGAIVNAQQAPQAGCNVLAVVVIAAAERAAIHLGSPDGPVLTFQQLPYPLE